MLFLSLTPCQPNLCFHTPEPGEDHDAAIQWTLLGCRVLLTQPVFSSLQGDVENAHQDAMGEAQEEG